MKDVYIFDCEVTAYDWLFVFKHKATGNYYTFHNDNAGIAEFIESVDPLLAGFNNKHYDQFILKSILQGDEPQQVKHINDLIIVQGLEGWQIPDLKGCTAHFSQYDLMDDCQQGLSLKAIEGHLGMDIRETTVDFNLNRAWTGKELDEMIFYCKHDVDATDKLDDLRQNYLQNKITLGAEKHIPPEQALYMTNAKLTAAYLDAKAPATPWDDEREYQFPATLKTEYIPKEVLDFFGRIHDKSIPSEELFSESLDLQVGGCPCTIAYGGIHGAIPCYVEEATETRSIRNKDVQSFYPHQLTLNGYTSRNIPNPDLYKATIERRITAKKSGDKATANALKLVLNTTYGAMLNKYNDLYDARMARAVCISGQLQLLELSEHLVKDCKTLKIIQLNTDGIMVSLDNTDVPKYQEITAEWQTRTGFTLEEDCIKKIVQKDVNNYVEIPADGGEPKIKGGMLVRGIAPAGAFNINNTAVIVAEALRKYLTDGTSIDDTVDQCNDISKFALISKVSAKYGDAKHEINKEMVTVQRVNRVYASTDYRNGTLYKRNLTTGTLEKVAGLPLSCIVDNEATADISVVDKEWYIRLAKKQADAFLGIERKLGNTRRNNQIKRRLLGGQNGEENHL